MVANDFAFILLLAITNWQLNEAVETTCDLPTPIKNQAGFSKKCMRYVSLGYLCDSDQLLSQTGGDKIDTTVTKYKRVFRTKNIGRAPNKLQMDTDRYAKATKCELGIVLVKNFRVPFHNFSHYASVASQTTCYVQASQYVMDNTAFLVLTNHTLFQTYLSYITDSIRRKWFGNDCGNNVLMIIVTESVIDSATKQILSSKPYFIITAGKTAVRRLGEERLDELRDLGVSLFWQRISLAGAVERVVDELGTALVRTGQQRHTRVLQHNIPMWATFSFLACFALITCLIVLDWLIVRRKGLSLRGGGGGKAPGKTGGDRVHTHMWF